MIKHLLLLLLLICSINSYSQVYGPEKVINGNFGTTADGMNGDGGIGKDIYPHVPTSVPDYFQPATRAFHNRNTVNVSINPGVVVGMPLANTSTSYEWGFTEPWQTGNYFFPENHSAAIPHAPNNGAYTIVTSTNGMYNLPSLKYISWYEIYDKYETNTNNPTNYFLVTNADSDASKIFYRQQITDIIPGQVYRMSVDIARLNTSGAYPNVSFVINSDGGDLENEPEVFHTGEVATGGQWINYSFDYVAPCSQTSTYVAFRNLQTNTNGNDLALDNLSMKAILPRISASIGTNCTQASFIILDNVIAEAFSSSIYRFQWQQKAEGNTNYTDMIGETNIQATILQPGTYRLSIYVIDPANSLNTQACRMYSNEIVISRNSGNSCLELAIPEAVDDVYVIPLGNSKAGNVLDNDLTSTGTNHSALSVIGYEVNGVNYAPNTTAVVNNGGGQQIGVITLNDDGTFDFQGLAGFHGVVPDIKYRIIEENAGQDSAYIKMTFVSYSIEVRDFCVECPINLNITSDSSIDPGVYVLFSGGVPFGTAQVNGNTMSFSFIYPTAGIIDFTLRRNGEDILTFPLQIAPRNATWVPSMVIQSPDWYQTYNWTSPEGTGFPLSCTNVTIPGNASLYPDLTTSPGRCDDITFESGSTLAKVHLLYYRRAFVQLSPMRENWMMLSAPLKYMYSADYHADPSWGNNAGVDPRIYMREFDIRFEEESIPNPDGTYGISIGSFSKGFANLKFRLQPTYGFVLKVAQGTNDAFDGTFYFPRLDSNGEEIEYKYHNRNTGAWIEDGDPNYLSDYYPFKLNEENGGNGRGSQEPTDDSVWLTGTYNITLERGRENRYRFIWENGSNIAPFTITVPNAGTTNIIGNPLMSHIDFGEFFNDNSARIQPYYRIWNGTTFYSYALSGQTDSGVWKGLPQVSTGDLLQMNNYIPPMQAFFVEMANGSSELTFDMDAISVAPHGDENKLKSTEEPVNVLYMKLTMNEEENVAIVASLPMASDDYNPAEDVYKLFSYEKRVPEIYTVANNKAIEINAVSNNTAQKRIPIGIKTTQAGQFKISFKGINSFSAYNSLMLVDVLNNKSYDLKKATDFSFEKDAAEFLEGRFYLIMDENLLGIDNNGKEADLIDLYVNQGLVTISAPTDKIRSVNLYDAAGRLLLNENKLDTSFYQFSPNLGRGVFIIKVKTATGQKLFKVYI